jgi:lipopolysaccharide heptosyltransferase II
MRCEAELNGSSEDSVPRTQLRRTIGTAFLGTARLGFSILAVIQTTLTRTLVRVRPRVTRGDIQRILVVKLDELGDLVMAWPLIHTLRSRLPEAELTLVVNRSVLGITEGMAGIRVIGVDVNCNKLLRPFILTIRHYRFVRNHLRNEKFDVCFLPRRDSDDVAATVLAYFTRSARRISFSEKSTRRKTVTNRSFDSLLTDILPAPPVQHETKTNLSLLAAIGLPPAACRQPLPLPAAAVRHAEDALPGSGAPYVAICPTSGHSSLKQWGVERFAEVASRLTAAGISVVLIGGPTDSQLGSVIQAACEGKCLNFIGNTSLSQMAAMLAKCSVFLGNDAGPLHVASALGVATLGIFGSSCWHQFGPWAPRHCVVVHEMSCSPCHDHTKNRCDVCIYGQPSCMNQVTTVEVFEALMIITQEERGYISYSRG